MGPFVPEFISNELNLVVAFVIGIAFGYVLEQAGFSSSRRLAGQFYGYDFTVLRVFFTAGITGMSGVLILGWAGLLDLDVIYVNPTWLWPAVVGGLIMGVGFVVGGYCPGTSVCAAAIGKIDAMWFIGGSLVGIFFYGEFFSFFKAFHESSALGPIKIYDTLGLPAGAFAFVLIVAALAAFAGTEMIERRVSLRAPSRSFPVRKHRIAAGVLLAVGLLLIFLPDRKTRTMEMVQQAAYQKDHPVQYMDVDEFAFRLLDQDPRMTVIDLRSAEQFRQSPLPGSVSAGLRDLFGKELLPVLSLRHIQKVFIADDQSTAEQAYRIAASLGYENLRVLTGGLQAFRSTILEEKGIESADVDTRHFRDRAKVELPVLMAEFKNRAGSVPKQVKKIQGGC